VKKPDAKWTERLVHSIEVAFEKAYMAHQCGHSLDAILIDYDIGAANAMQHEVLTACHRSAIRAAVSSSEKRIPLPLALAYMTTRIDYMVESYYESTRNDTKRK